MMKMDVDARRWAREEDDGKTGCWLEWRWSSEKGKKTIGEKGNFLNFV